METATALAFAIKALEVMPTIVHLTEDAVKYIENTVSALKVMQLEGRDPSDAEWDALNATDESMRASRPAV